MKNLLGTERIGTISPSPIGLRSYRQSPTFGSIVRSNFLSHALATALQQCFNALFLRIK
jgi:hypothetical protein